jgi:hypothetical protein
MKNVFWDIKTQSIPHRKHVTYPLQNPAFKFYVRIDVFAAVTMKMPSSAMCRCVSLVRTDVSEEYIASSSGSKESVAK